MFSTAEAAAVVGLVSAIASLIDLSTRTVFRLREFSSKSSDIPASFSSLSVRLPSLTTSLERISANAKTEHLQSTAVDALEAVVRDTLVQLQIVQAHLLKIIPSEDASKLSRAFIALKSLAKEEKINHTVEKIFKNIKVLILDQTTQHTELSNKILVALSNLSFKPPETEFVRGVCLNRAPQIPADAYVGRTHKLQQLRHALQTARLDHQRSLVVISGMGGMGKTQLSLAHVQDCANDYSSVFWVVAKDQVSLKQSLADLSGIIRKHDPAPIQQSHNEEQAKIDHV